MIKIVTAEGVSLDLAPDAEFVIEYNNPMMEDDRIPVPFSTDIALLPSATNCKTLRYLPAFKLEPAVRELSASLVLDGIPFLTGTLSYNGIEDGRLNYTFAGKDISSEWGKKIYDLFDDEYASPISAPFTSRYSWVFFPLLVNKDYTGYFVKGQDDIFFSKDFNNEQPATVEKNVKYHNFENVIPESGTSRRTPVIPADKIISGRFSAADELGEMLSKVVVVGQYAATRSSASGVEAASTLPDLTFAEFAQELAKMFCAAFYENGAGGYDMMSAEKVFAIGALDDWTDKISDSFSCERECASGYSFGYENSGEDTFNDAVEIGRGNSMKASLYPTDTDASEASDPVKESHIVELSNSVCVSAVTRAGQCVRRVNTGDKTGNVIASAADVVFQNNEMQSNVVTDADTVENKCGFNLIKCVPAILSYYDGVTYEIESYKMLKTLYQRFSTAGVIEPQSADAERGSDVYVGLINNGQISDSGYVLDSDVPDNYPTLDEIAAMADIPLIPQGETEAISLRPDWLYEHFHKSYAEWLAKDRQLLSCDINLDAFDLVNFRMYRKVLIHGREFFVKKLSVTLRADSRAMECSAEFISA